MIHHHRHIRKTAGGEKTALRRALILTTALFVVEVVGGILSNSLALLSDAGHMLTDLLALGLSGAAIGFAAKPPTERKTFGFYRLEILSTLANGVLLAVLAGGILAEALHRFGDAPRIRIDILVPVAAAGLVANLVSFRWLSRAQGGLSTRAALWHVGADSVSSLLVLAAAGGMALTGWWWLDPSLSVILATVMATGAYRLLRDSVEILLEAAPKDMEVERVEKAMRAVSGVEAVHDLHIWSLTSEVHALSGHLQVRPENLAETDRILGEARGVLEREFRITHTTLQVESERCGEVVCVLGPTEPVETSEKRG